MNGAKGFVFTRFTVFDWHIHHKTLEAGDSYLVDVTEDVAESEKDNAWLWTRGHVTCCNYDTGEVRDDRTVGMFSGDRPGYAAGRYHFEATEASEFWCMNGTVNRRRLPGLTALRAAEGDTVNLVAGTRLLVCRGWLEAPGVNHFTDAMSIEVGENEATLIARAPTYGLIFQS